MHPSLDRWTFLQSGLAPDSIRVRDLFEVTQKEILRSGQSADLVRCEPKTVRGVLTAILDSEWRQDS
jgi:hypothetical protein